jgi:hypothetical protein
MTSSSISRILLKPQLNFILFNFYFSFFFFCWVEFSMYWIKFNPHHLVLWSFLGLSQWVYVRDDMSKGLKIMSLGVINHGMSLSVPIYIWTHPIWPLWFSYLCDAFVDLYLWKKVIHIHQYAWYIMYNLFIINLHKCDFFFLFFSSPLTQWFMWDFVIILCLFVIVLIFYISFFLCGITQINKCKPIFL